MQMLQFFVLFVRQKKACEDIHLNIVNPFSYLNILWTESMI